MFVAIVEVAPLDDGNAHRLEVIDTRGKEISRRMILGRHRPSIDFKRDDKTILT